MNSYRKLKALHHSNGKPVVKIYGNYENEEELEETQGPIVTINICRE